jgi:hypothetical protein
MTEFYAQPYSLDHTGFYFDSIEKFEAGMHSLNKRGCEEVEIQFIDGDAQLAALASVVSIHQGDVHFWFEQLEDLDDTEIVQLTLINSRLRSVAS